MGVVDLKTGNNKVFNYVREWGGEPSQMTVAENLDNNRRVLINGWGSPSELLPRGTHFFMYHDQTRREIGRFISVSVVTGDMSLDLLAQTARKAGKNRMYGYVLK